MMIVSNDSTQRRPPEGRGGRVFYGVINLWPK